MINLINFINETLSRSQSDRINEWKYKPDSNINEYISIEDFIKIIESLGYTAYVTSIDNYYTNPRDRIRVFSNPQAGNAWECKMELYFEDNWFMPVQRGLDISKDKQRFEKDSSKINEYVNFYTTNGITNFLEIFVFENNDKKFSLDEQGYCKFTPYNAEVIVNILKKMNGKRDKKQ